MGTMTAEDDHGQQRTRTSLPLWTRGLIAALCTLLYVAAVPLTVAVYHVNLVLAFLVATVQCGSLGLAVVRPRLGAALHLAAIVALVLLTRGSPEGTWPLPVAGLLSLGGLVLLLGLRERWPLAVGVWWASVVVVIVLVAASPARYAVPDVWGTNLTIYTSGSAAVLITSIALGQRRRIRADLLAARRDVELEQSRRHLVEERARISRDLHDVVAHSMSLVHIQALSAPYRLTQAPRAEVDAEFNDIARLAASALAEMRQLLGVLRPDQSEAALAPQPQLGAIADLATSTTRAGTTVEVDIDPRAHGAGAVVQVTAYRIVQEALSNVVRHAPGAATTVTIRHEQEALQVQVHNHARPGALPPGRAPDHGGHGLQGMAERARLVGGTVSATPLDGHGFLVEATLPASPARATAPPTPTASATEGSR